MGSSQWKGRVNPNGLDRTLQGAVLVNSTQHRILKWTAVALRFAAKARLQPLYRFAPNMVGRIQQKLAPLTDKRRVDMTDRNMLKSTLNHVLY